MGDSAIAEDRVRTQTSDEELLTRDDAEAFGAFYARHLPGVEAYFARRVHRDAAADLAAETFASAFVARRRFVPGGTPAAGWLYTIAARRLVDFQRRGITEQRTLAALARGAERTGPGALDSPAALVADLGAGLLRHLPREQRYAIVAHLVSDLDYTQIASQVEASEASIRQRVSRGFSTLREPLRVYRAAHALAAQARAYEFGGGHGKDLRLIGKGEALDCSASASLILQQAGQFEPGPAWTTDRIASAWGRLGEGRYVTVWANGEHVWIEFKLEAEEGERFDPTPSRLAPNAEHDVVPTTPGPACDYTPRHWPGL
jgi:RNA polymerase sigma-70 factor (ECF subfamily)